MTSDVASAGEAFVWIWLPGATEPVIAGRLAHDRDGRLTFNYGQSYLARGDAIAIYEPELPLRAGLIEAASKMQLPSAIRSEEHTSELQSLMRISYAVFCLKNKKKTNHNKTINYYKPAPT